MIPLPGGGNTWDWIDPFGITGSDIRKPINKLMNWVGKALIGNKGLKVIDKIYQNTLGKYGLSKVVKQIGREWGRVTNKWFGANNAWMGYVLPFLISAFLPQVGIIYGILWELPGFNDEFWAQQMQKSEELMTATFIEAFFDDDSYDTVLWFPGSDEWNGTFAGGELYNATGLIEPWYQTFEIEQELDMDGLYNKLYYDGVIPTSPEMRWAGDDGFFKLWGMA